MKKLSLFITIIGLYCASTAVGGDYSSPPLIANPTNANTGGIDWSALASQAWHALEQPTNFAPTNAQYQEPAVATPAATNSGFDWTTLSNLFSTSADTTTRTPASTATQGSPFVSQITDGIKTYIEDSILVPLVQKLTPEQKQELQNAIAQYSNKLDPKTVRQIQPLLEKLNLRSSQDLLKYQAQQAIPAL